ncbi:hypothetical protein NsoK4_03600 [Nitrosopumilus sp. K4]|uniref:hypothetical protein n=1 Tax=Nitrosopumilus sp. K4 TaxID=2795383 RepID=UPI001BAB804E|nr:hypothetical protein [Nitrosopumilus sp. K4]QUC65340.1 hypothetical protein NsoK4_03600 [Nitrosopumilus sp. K4]
MEDDSKIIRTEIMRVLNENGKIRATDLMKRVLKKVGNEKMIYREISSLVESGEVEKKIHSKSHIEYELINISESVNNQLKNLHKELEISLSELQMFDESTQQMKMSFHQRVRSIIHFIHIVQSIESIMKFLSYYPSFKKDKMFSQINRKIDDYWEKIMQFVTQQSEDEFLNEVIANIRITQINSENVN